MALTQKDRIAVVIAVAIIGVVSLARLGFSRLARGDDARALTRVLASSPTNADRASAAADGAAAAELAAANAAAASATAGGIPTGRLIEICGLGKVRFEAQEPIDVSPFMQKIVGDAQSRWSQRLANSGELRARAAGLLLTNWLSDHGAAQHDTLVAREELVQLAVGSGDPALYALAYNKCRGSTDEACRQVGTAAWARIDPDNAAPWLLAAAEARQSGNRPAEAVAIARAAQTHRLDSYNFSLLGFATGEMPRDLGDPQRYFLQMDLIGIDAAALDMHTTEGIRYCKEEVPRNPAVRPQCAALAELFAGKGSLLIEQQAAASIGSFSGWSEQRVAEARQQVKALMESVEQVSGASDPADTWTCASMARANRHFRRMASQGEVGAAREAQQSIGVDAAELARRYDERVAALIETSRAAAQVEHTSVAP